MEKKYKRILSCCLEMNRSVRKQLPTSYSKLFSVSHFPGVSSSPIFNLKGLELSLDHKFYLSWHLYLELDQTNTRSFFSESVLLYALHLRKAFTKVCRVSWEASCYFRTECRVGSVTNLLTDWEVDGSKLEDVFSNLVRQIRGPASLLFCSRERDKILITIVQIYERK